MNILNSQINRKINSVRSWSSRKVEFLSKITPFLPQKFECANYIFPIPSISFLSFIFLARTGLDFFAKIIGEKYVFCCSAHISFKPTIHLKLKSFENKVFK